MDLYVERQYVDDLRKGENAKFLPLFDENFEQLYKYVARRVSDRGEVERIVRLTFLDALGQAQTTPTDVNYLIWLYGLARPRVFEFVARESAAQKHGLLAVDEGLVKSEFFDKADKMIVKLSLEEREILRLKFFEQIADGEVMSVLGMDQGTIGPKIYGVLKRAHLLLFGQSDDLKAVYFGELSAFFEQIRSAEKIEVPEVFKISLRADLMNRVDRKKFAVEAEVFETSKTEASDDMPFEVVEEPVKEKTKTNLKEDPFRVGSDDPAKIFVQAVKEMREEEQEEAYKESEKFEKREALLDIFDRFKAVFILVPVIIFVLVFSFVVGSLIDFGPSYVARGYPNECDIEVVFDGEFSDGERRSINKGVSDRICNRFEVRSLAITRVSGGEVDVMVGVPDWLLKYNFVKNIKDWRIKKYERALSSNQQSG